MSFEDFKNKYDETLKELLVASFAIGTLFFGFIFKSVWSSKPQNLIITVFLAVFIFFAYVLTKLSRLRKNPYYGIIKTNDKIKDGDFSALNLPEDALRAVKKLKFITKIGYEIHEESPSKINLTATLGFKDDYTSLNQEFLKYDFYVLKRISLEKTSFGVKKDA